MREEGMNVTEDMANVIMGALAVCYSEGISGTTYVQGVDYDKVEFDIVERLHDHFPEIVKQYSWLPAVKRISDES